MTDKPTDDINWDDMASSAFVKFVEVGDEVYGTITAVRPGTDFNGNPCPYLDLVTEDGERTVSCGQANLKAQIVALKPRAGDTIRITFTHEEKAEKGMRKMFTVEHSSPLGTVETSSEEPGF